MIGACILVVPPICDFSLLTQEFQTASHTSGLSFSAQFSKVSVGLDGICKLCYSTSAATGGATAPQPRLQGYIYIERYIDIFFAPFEYKNSVIVALTAGRLKHSFCIWKTGGKVRLW